MKRSSYTGKKYRNMGHNYIQIALHPADVPYPYQSRDLKLRGNRFKYDTIGIRLALFMTDKELEVQEFCDMCQQNSKDTKIKLTSSDIHKYLRGKCGPKSEKLKLMADTMGVSEAWLTGWKPIAEIRKPGDTMVHSAA